jgi:salicylate hydroxylase
LWDRWHNALKNVADGIEIDPESVKMRNRWLYAFDAEQDAFDPWQEMSSKVAEELRTNSISPLCDARVQDSQHGGRV